MITYQYLCNNCQDTFETQQSIKDQPLQKCRNCKKLSLERLIFAVDFFDKTPRTLGTLAERKTKEKSYEQQDYHKNIEDQKEIRKANARKALQEKHPNIKFKEPKKEKPWYGEIEQSKKDQIFSDPSGKKAEKYILEGK